MRWLWGLVFWALATCAHGINISAILENKLQIDNRLTHNPRVLWELWGDVDLLGNQGAWNTHLTWVNQVSTLSDNSGSQLYQAYWVKNLPNWGSSLRLGRFQHTDLSGFYILDGGQWDTQWKQWQLRAYGGQARRFDQIFTADIDAIFGFNVAYSGTLDHRLGSIRWRSYRAQLGYQRVSHENTSNRLQVAVSNRGLLGEKRFWEMSLSGTYHFDRSHLENAWFHGFADLTRYLRLRSNFEHYWPKNPLPSFRERFVYAYASGDQSLLRIGLQHSLLPKFSYFFGGQRSTRGDSFEGYGIWGDSSIA